MPQKKSVPRECEKCTKIFFVRPIDLKKGRGIYCSLSCKSKALNKLTSGSGEENPNWKGGLTKSSKGYWYVKKPGHPRASKNGYVKRADLVLEKKLGRLLHEDEIAHHVNLNKEDDSPDNLELTTYQGHGHLHRKNPPKQLKPNHPVNRRYAWPENAALLEMHSRLTLREIATQLGCSWSVVGRRLKRIKNSL
jgi:hypothetical protein